MNTKHINLVKRFTICIIVLSLGFVAACGSNDSDDAVEQLTDRINELESELEEQAEEQAEEKPEEEQPEEKPLDGPSLKAATRLKQLSARSDDMLDEAIMTLKELLTALPDSEDKTDVYLNLADVYWEKSESFFEKAYGEDLEESIFQAEEAGHDDIATQLRAKQESYLTQQSDWRKNENGAVAFFQIQPS